MKKNIKKRVLIISLVVILGISGFSLFTWHIGQIFVNLVSASPVSVQQVEVTSSEILTLSEIKIWTCQLGVFKNRKNADLFVDDLKGKGWVAEIIEDDPNIVAVGAFYTREKAALCREELLKSSIDGWIKEESFPALHYKISGKDTQKISLILKTVNSLLRGEDRNNVKKEYGEKIKECPADFINLNNLLFKVLTTEGEENEDQFQRSYDQELLSLFVEYKTITTKYSDKNI